MWNDPRVSKEELLAEALPLRAGLPSVDHGLVDSFKRSSLSVNVVATAPSK